MWEFGIAVGVIGVLLVTGLLQRFAPWLELLRAGAWLVVLGTTTSILAGIVYHAALYRVLRPRHALTPRWWLNPTALHGSLLASERPRVMPWFFMGALSFGIVMLGCLTVLLAVWRGS